MGALMTILAEGITQIPVMETLPALNKGVDWILVQMTGWFGNFGGFAWTMIIFTLMLKIVLFPLDYLSRRSMKKNQMIQESLAPQLAKLEKQCKGDKTLFQQKQMALMRKEGYRLSGACLPSLITLALFIYIFSALGNYTAYTNAVVYDNMVKEYNTIVQEYAIAHESEGFIEIKSIPSINSEELKPIYDSEGNIFAYSDRDVEAIYDSGGKILSYTMDISLNPDTKNIKTVAYVNADGKIIAYTDENGKIVSYVEFSMPFTTEDGMGMFDTTQQKRLAEEYKRLNPRWLWIKNTIRPDGFNTAIPTFSDVNKDAIGSPGIGNYISGDTVEDKEENYNRVMGFYWGENDKGERVLLTREGSIANEYNEHGFKIFGTHLNGWFLLPLLAAGVSFLTQFLSQRMQGSQAAPGAGGGAMKVMLVIFPVMMLFFAVSYTSGFSLYILTNSLATLGGSYLINWLSGKELKRKFEKKALEKKKTSYSR